ncbi:leucocin A/sakacin P family class II bacteriocin [Listeria aquatica]|uniref:Bacteriocin n=1 Tax=Listeria aquatica FSL S10-1188 TaxID=1265818 RepID=W7BP40_9LIST|nr:leucocin A/sakacin P family class II bacteriocin [Listeria aquatica]EUJ21803.1 hypothetical protein MAQA_00290 [Listeria aquatica FSL S10-1188]
MKKRLGKLLIVCAFASVLILTLTPEKAEAKYYGNGVSCSKKKCSVNWGQAWTEGIKRWGNNLFGSVSG